MKKLLLLIFISMFCAHSSFAQQKTISGKVIDTFNKETLEYATVTVLRASDSVLLGFARTNSEGNFTLKIAEEKKYLVLVTCPGFADYIDAISPSASPSLPLGNIVLFTREKLLTEIMVHQKRGAMIIKGDTTEYIADSFKVDANANVEDLLKKLPGIQVDKNGQVTAQGEKVTKILVDGEEFFSDDPAVVNKNLQAKTIEKVQVFDKKSENAEFTGIDDGEKIKTINLQMKDKYKKGYFGKVALGGGNNGFFENQGMFNLFRGKQKFSVYGIAANTGRVGLSGNDADKFGSGGRTFTESEDGGFSYFTGDDDDGGWDGQYNGQGLPKAWTAGAHFSDKWNENKHHINFNYRFNRKNIEMLENNFTQYTLPDSVYYNDQKGTSFSTSDRHGLTGLYEWTIDSLSTIKVTANAAKTNSNRLSNQSTDTRGNSGVLMNNSTNKTTNETEGQKVSTSLIWKKRFKKKGRNLLLEADFNQAQNNSNGFLNATNTFYSGGVQDSTTHIDQKKRKENETNNLSANFTYTEPVSKKGFLELKYKFSNQNNYSRQLSFNKNTGGDYAALDTLFSTDYDFDVQIHRAGASLRWVYDKLNFSFGSAVSNTQFLQTDNLFGTKKERNFNNFFPSATLNYKFSQQRSIYFSYRGYTQQPSIEQLQPIRQNADPLNISIGNPNLGQSFTNSFSFRYNSYKVLKGTYYYASGGTSFVKDAISTNQNVTESGIRTYQNVNVSGNYSAYMYAGAGYKLQKWNVNYGFNLNANTNSNNNFVNGQKNKSDNNSFGLGLNIGHDKEKKYDISFNPSVNYTINNSSVNKVTTAFWSTSQDLSVLVYLPFKCQFNTNISWNVRQRTAAFDRNNNVFLVNAFVSKKFMKKDDIEVRLSVFDIFNQNKGFSQQGYGNVVQQQTYNTIRRYGMLSFVWNFSHSPKADATDETQAIEIK